MSKLHLKILKNTKEQIKIVEKDDNNNNCNVIDDNSLVTWNMYVGEVG